VLAGSYYERTGDREFLQQLWPHIEFALQWINKFGDMDGDGFVEYAQHSSKGLVQQGWKDSNDSVFHADGMLAEAPIALCEVQGYVYAAKLAAARLSEMLGDKEKCSALESEAEKLRVNFEEAFWCDDLSTYALALDGHKKPCRVRTSKASRVATGQLCLLAVAITPAGLMELVRSYCPINGGPPTKHGGRAPALIVSRPAQRSLHVTACMLAKSPKRPSPPEAPTASFPPPPLRLLPGGANPVPGRDFHPQSTSLFTAHA
jgi:hypothetical protein